MNLSLRMAWRNLWRHKRRTWLTTTAMIFSNVLLVFMISLQFGSYDMMINNTLQAFSGHIQVQDKAYNGNPKLRSSIAGIVPLANQMRRAVPVDDAIDGCKYDDGERVKGKEREGRRDQVPDASEELLEQH